jgi:sugar lactone lactonase YvrE
MAARRLLAALALAGACIGLAQAEQPRVLAASYPEGPLWQDERLYFAEMRADRVTLSDVDGERAFFVQHGCGPTAIAPYGEGFLILCHLGARIVAVDSTGQEVRRWERDESGAPLTSPNDASADNRGGVYLTDSGAFSRASRREGRVMYLSADGALTRVAGPLWYANGVHVAGDALYVSEHIAGRVLRYAIEAPGRLGPADTFVDLSAVRRPRRYQPRYELTGPDGLEFGPDGALYVAIYGEGRLLRFSPSGELLGMIEVPTRFLTNVAFGARGMALTGAFDNRTPLSPGEVRIEAPP